MFHDRKMFHALNKKRLKKIKKVLLSVKHESLSVLWIKHLLSSLFSLPLRFLFAFVSWGMAPRKKKRWPTPSALSLGRALPRVPSAKKWAKMNFSTSNTNMNEYELAEIFIANNLSRWQTIQHLDKNEIPLPSPRLFFWAELIAAQTVCQSQRNWNRRSNFDCWSWRRKRLTRHVRSCRSDLQSVNLSEDFTRASLLATKTVFVLEWQTNRNRDQ